jgi:hypothetical protein
VTVVAPRLHLPDEPVGHKAAWRDAVVDGTALDEVLSELDTWLWARWRILESVAFDHAAFTSLVKGYRRELWLWLAGERTWEQCCSGLVGRIGRRMPA